MKYKKVSVEEIMGSYKEAPKVLAKEIKDRLTHFCMNIDGTFNLPFDDPALFDVWKMVLRLTMKMDNTDKEDM